jgi:hypothetical protein
VPSKGRLSKGTVGVTAAPTPVNTTSLRNDKSKDSHASLVPVGNNVWGQNSGGGNDSNDSHSGDGERSQTRPAPWTSKSQPETDASDGAATATTTTTVTPVQVVKENKRRSWADSDDDDDDDDEEEEEVVETNPAGKHVPFAPVTASHDHSRGPSSTSLTQDVRYNRDRDGPSDHHRGGNPRTFVKDSFPPSRHQHQPPQERDMPRGGRYESNQPVRPFLAFSVLIWH